MRVWFPGIFFLIGVVSLVGPSAGAVESSSRAWVEIVHRVRPGQNMRSIAKRYYGVRQGAFCVAAQVGLSNPDLLHVGQELRFFVPPRKFRLQEYLSLDLVCSPGQVSVNGTSWSRDPAPLVADTSVLPEPLDRGAEEPDPESLWSRGWSRSMTVGAGLTYSRISQVTQDYNFGFTSVRVGAASLNVRGAWSHDWAAGFSADQGPAVLSGEQVGAEAVTLSFRSLNLVGVLRPRRSRFEIAGETVHPSYHFGVGDQSIPILQSPGGDPVRAVPGGVQNVRLGFGLSVTIGDRWLAEGALNWAQPVAFQVFTQYQSRLAFDGSLSLQRRFAEDWLVGANWHGHYGDVDFAYELEGLKYEGRLQSLQSSLELTLGRRF